MKIIMVSGWIVVFVGDWVVANEPYTGREATIAQLREVFRSNGQVKEGLYWAEGLEILTECNPISIRYQ